MFYSIHKKDDEEKLDKKTLGFGRNTFVVGFQLSDCLQGERTFPMQSQNSFLFIFKISRSMIEEWTIKKNEEQEI